MGASLINRALPALVLFLSLIAQPMAAPPATADPADVGEWEEPIEVGVIGIHAILLPTGKVLLYSVPEELVSSPARIWDPETDTTTDVSIPLQRRLFCTGHSILADGRPFLTGGQARPRHGVTDTDFLDPQAETWTPGPGMSRKRYYPTNVTLGDGRVLIFGGQRDNDFTQRSVELYEPSSNTIEMLPRSANRVLGLYPRIHLLPGGRLFWSGEQYADEEPVTAFFNVNTSRWKELGDFKANRRFEAPAVLLPGLREILVPGGGRAFVQRQANGMTSSEIIDFGAPNPRWQYTAPMNLPRGHHNAVLLPDGTVLVVGGAEHGPYKDPVKEAEIFDPETGTWEIMAAQQAPRAHHSTALLLPDGRVMTAGQNEEDEGFAETVEIFSPPYLHKGTPRPLIASAPTDVEYGDPLPITTDEALDIERVALVRPGAVTHANDMEQRYVDLDFETAAGVVNAEVPSNPNVAPPGYYMLFIVDSEGVPSEAAWVQVA
ncbi:MAG: galactose oxidase-like domain-containing protein [Actinomycetota bacterium]